MREKSWFREYGLILAAGVAVGIAALILTASGNPKNMGFCIACFLRDIAGALGLHSAANVQYIRSEIIGIVVGAAAGSSGCQGVPGKGRGLSRLPVCAGDVRDDRCSGVSGLPPADGHPAGRRRPDCRCRAGGLHRRDPGGRGMFKEGLLPGPGLSRPHGRGVRPVWDPDGAVGAAAVGAHPAEVL